MKYSKQETLSALWQKYYIHKLTAFTSQENQNILDEILREIKILEKEENKNVSKQ